MSAFLRWDSRGDILGWLGELESWLWWWAWRDSRLFSWWSIPCARKFWLGFPSVLSVSRIWIVWLALFFCLGTYFGPEYVLLSLRLACWFLHGSRREAMRYILLWHENSFSEASFPQTNLAKRSLAQASEWPSLLCGASRVLHQLLVFDNQTSFSHSIDPTKLAG